MPSSRSVKALPRRILTWLPLVTLTAAVLLALPSPPPASAEPAGYVIVGQVIDGQDQPVAEAEITFVPADSREPIARTASLEDGSWSISLEKPPHSSGLIEIERHHFEARAIALDLEAVQRLEQNGSYNLGAIALERRITPGFWAAGAIFILVLLAIAFERLHSTTAALTGLASVMLVTAVGSAVSEDWFIFDFERALTYINWEVIFLVMAMMILIAIIEHTGIFQWTAFQAYRLSRGKAWLLVLILMAVTAIASALLDNFTTMLLMTPISLQIGLALGINPLALIIPEVLASNVGGISTLIGTPTNILIGAYAGIGFSGFLANQTIGVLFALLVMAGYVLYHYRAEWRKVSGGISQKLYDRLSKNARITDPSALLTGGVIFVLVLVGFVVGERLHVVPAVPALIGATALLVWLKPDVQGSITAVDWTTLVFFMALFIVVGAIQEVGLISLIAEAMGRLIGDSLVLGIVVIVFGVGTFSTAIANIPLAASMLPVVEFLSGTVPGAGSRVLYYALSMGAAMGGNGLLIGGEANLVTAGITQQAGSPISFSEFLKVGLPVTYLTLAAGFLWLLLRFVVVGG